MFEKDNDFGEILELNLGIPLEDFKEELAEHNLQFNREKLFDFIMGEYCASSLSRAFLGLFSLKFQADLLDVILSDGFISEESIFEKINPNQKFNMNTNYHSDNSNKKEKDINDLVDYYIIDFDNNKIKAVLKGDDI